MEKANLTKAGGIGLTFRGKAGLPLFAYSLHVIIYNKYSSILFFITLCALLSLVMNLNLINSRIPS